MGRYGPPEGPGAFSRQQRCAPLMVHVPLRDTRLAGGKNRSGEMGRYHRDLVLEHAGRSQDLMEDV